MQSVVFVFYRKLALGSSSVLAIAWVQSFKTFGIEVPLCFSIFPILGANTCRSALAWTRGVPGNLDLPSGCRPGPRGVQSMVGIPSSLKGNNFLLSCCCSCQPSLLSCSGRNDSGRHAGILSLTFNHHLSYRWCVLMSLEQSKLELCFYVLQQEPPPETGPECAWSI